MVWWPEDNWVIVVVLGRKAITAAEQTGLENLAPAPARPEQQRML
jgi:hypothetical protein